MELSTEDKQRIYKEVNRIFNESESVDLVHELMFKVGEYATLYERQQQANLKQDDTWLKKLEFYTKGFDTKKFQKVEEYVKWVRIRDDLPNEPLPTLEAERSEVRNKVIEQAIDICKDYEVGWQVADIIEKLNSLKTK